MPRPASIHAVAGALALLFAVASAPPAHAQSAPSAKQQFASAQKLFEDKRYAEALPEFRALLAGSGSPNARLYVARCLRELGDLPAAFEEMSTTLKDARSKAEGESKYVQTRDAAAGELAVLEGKIGKIVIAIADDATGAQVTLNGKPVALDRLGTPIAAAPGDVVVRVIIAGHEPIERHAASKGGETTTVAISFRPGAPAPAPSLAGPVAPTPTPESAPAAETTGGGVRKLGFVTVGLGVAGGLVFAITGSMASSKYSSVKDACGGVRCADPGKASDIDSGKSLDTIANVGLVVGIVGVVAGVTMIAFGGPKAAPRATVGVAPAPGGGALRFSGEF